MTIRLSVRFLSFVLLGLLALAGIFLVLHSTPDGLSLTDDSIGYIAGARSMLAGHGYREAWLATNGPVTHFPPAFSSVLALIGLFGLDPLRAARFLNASLFGLNMVLLCILGWRMTKSLPAGLVLAALFLVNDSLLRVHATALSEPLFIFLTLLALWMFDLYFERDAHWLWLVLCGAFVGLAYLTRYAALALVFTFALALWVLHDTPRKRLARTGLFLVSVVPWIAGWAIHNDLVGGSVTNRVLVWHPITLVNFDTGLRTASTFLMPIEAWRQSLFRVPGLFFVSIVIVLLAVMVWLVLGMKRRWAHPVSAGAGKPKAILFANGLYVFGYLASIVAAMTFFDASTKFKLRILSPVYVALLMLLVALGTWAWRRRRVLVMALGLLIFGISIAGQYAAVTELTKGGQGYASFKWYDSTAMAYLRGLPAGVMIYTNEPGAVYLYARRAAYVLPDRVDPVTAEARPGFEQGVAQMQGEIKAGRAVLALFSGGDTPASDAGILSNGLYLAHKSGGAEVYAAAP